DRFDDLLLNYHLTFSLAENNDADADRAIAAGINVAVVVRTPELARRSSTAYANLAPLPATWNGRPMIDGDESDLRYLDETPADGRGLYVGLRVKGRAVHDRTGFVPYGDP